ncbi:MAG: hypothetical protein A3A83_01645 [Candidatus Doudnabacteria bacterium RIFCSPLOWO2_01_FULL_48_57]|uniref:Inositol-1-monophosphatase n=1 Tax=Candidatus Doudnabacteria bacterium RIFCSPLOWO2_02_FULL_48_13 TaxID=1817845 RepID=A0A1F5Q9K8_9BACT|nr:MAG: hypothetical protein A3K05_03535 [Candidatus Doudnabacteria bacterium RIFCSPHIGHO2_01_48_18]OGE79490.1 MAG: hypothetical protein A2668_00095 [Candidatus Doudnabacteria bacterium RIFCSPHIGHO2_01_FULL_48_180]OGE91323.1 MAG: hypothetical protein A3F44_03370 [Candidatus Doudnabacteria bacterium RIFCSPHIGHO2_12_FULL_47_25]OGE96654.1 MAG: hypothetical protein A3A83_01645 [Candidatus Doudnabacteria bacterium RIFCSPLOWO2_01_FULL_48_57]OGE98863.1 MAG: hypothetical protein A3J05_03155 [Candidatus
MEQFIKNLAKGAGQILRQGFKQEIQIKQKQGHWDPVTQYDLAVDKFIQDRVRKKFPSHGILSEEGTDIKNQKHLWIIDPIDGTRNFSRGIAYFCISIAYAKSGVLSAAAVYDPMQDELFFAAKNKGAFLNGKKITVSPISSPEHALDVSDFNSSVSVAMKKKVHRFHLKTNAWSIHKGASALDLANTAAGRFDFAIQIGAYPWDYSAAGLILKEAGAKTTDLKGKPYRWDSKEIIAANPKLHPKILKLLK